MSPLEVLVFTWACLAAAYSGYTALRLRRDPVVKAPEKWPRVLLLRPLDAPSPLKAANLAAPLDYPGEVEQVVLSPYRPSRPEGVRWLYSDPLGPNRTVGHLRYALSVLSPEEGVVVVSAEAGVGVNGALLRALVAALLGGAELAVAAPVPAGGGGLGGLALRSLLHSTHQSVFALDASTPGAHTACGKAMAMGPQAQRTLAELSACIGEDLALASRLQARGYAVGLVAEPARCPQPRRLALRPVLDRIGRWMQVLRAHRPALGPTVPLLFAPTLPLVVAASLLGGWAAAAAALLLAARTALAWRLSRLTGLPPTFAVLGWPLGEVLLLASFVRSLRPARMLLCGREYAMASGGRLDFIG